jgi:hypothetical protein
MKRNTTVNRKASPHPIAANLSRVLTMIILLEYSDDAVRSSDVMRSIIAVTASQRLRSVSVRGMFISITIFYLSQTKKEASSFLKTSRLLSIKLSKSFSGITLSMLTISSSMLILKVVSLVKFCKTLSN